MATQLRLAELRLATGDVTRALVDLERLAVADPAQVQAELALYAVHVKRRDFDKALATVAAIEKKQPGSALAADLRGAVHMAKRETAVARTSFTKALAAEPGRLSSARNLAALDLQEGKAADAIARYEKMIAADPRSPTLLLALAEALALSGASHADVKSAVDRAIAADPASVAARLALVSHHRRIGDMPAALEAARTAAAALGNEPQVVQTLGSLQLAAGEYAQARTTFNRLVLLQPSNPAPLLRVADAYIAAKDYTSALEAQRKAVALAPDYTPAIIALAATLAAAGQPEAAILEARTLQRERPNQAIGFVMESEVRAGQKQWTEAAAALRQALERQPAPLLAARLYALLQSGGKDADARAFADRWVKEHPRDADFRSLLAQQAQRKGDLAGAAAGYRAALEVDSDNPLLINNLAWVLAEQGRPEAREIAERAYRLAPLNPAIVDTYGWILVRQGDVARGLPLLRAAVNLAPGDLEIRLHLAQALAKSGDKAGARREAEQIVARDTKHPAKAEAQKLVREL
jgi:putative PEP-CTERM system TPR-repeat lipoprotein